MAFFDRFWKGSRSGAPEGDGTPAGFFPTYESNRPVDDDEDDDEELQSSLDKAPRIPEDILSKILLSIAIHRLIRSFASAPILPVGFFMLLQSLQSGLQSLIKPIPILNIK